MSKYLLMNKNIKVALIEYNADIPAIISIDRIYNLDYAPLSVARAKFHEKSELKVLNAWFKGRGIPSWRDDLDSILTNLQISAPEELLDKAFALSLSDQYWIMPADMNINWSQVNFFENDFDSADFAEATFSSLLNRADINYKTPNNTSDGMLKKAWIIKDHERLLIKGGYKKSRQEPLNEKLASMVCKVLGFDYVNYEVETYKNSIVSSCKCFITSDTELISANDIYFSEKKPNHINDYNYYISILEKNGIYNAREQMENMLVLDYLLMNEDRHTRNFGVIRNVETLKWERVAPIFDTGQSMNTQRETLSINFRKGAGKLFTNTNCDFEKLLPLITDFSRFDVDKLKPIVSLWEELLLEWQPVTMMDNTKIYKLIDGLQIRIDKFEKYQDRSLNQR